MINIDLDTPSDNFSCTFKCFLYWNLLHVQNSIGNWRRKQDDVPIDIQPQ